MEGIHRIQGRDLSELNITEIRSLIAAHPDWHRTRLSVELTRIWNWRSATGEPQDMAARSLLLKLEQRGWITLPPRQFKFYPRLPRISSQGTLPLELPAIAEPLSGLLPLRVEIVSPKHPDSALFSGNDSYLLAAAIVLSFVTAYTDGGAASQALIQAARNGDLAGAEQAVKDGADVNGADVVGNTPLIAAASASPLDGGDGSSAVWSSASERRAEDGRRAGLAAFLLSHGAKVGAASSMGVTALTAAAQNGWVAVVETLLRKGARIDDKNALGLTALMVAASQGRQSIARLLVKKGAKISAKDFMGNTALMYAVQNDHADVARFLVSKGADPRAKDLTGDSPLSLAAQVTTRSSRGT